MIPFTSLFQTICCKNLQIYRQFSVAVNDSTSVWTIYRDYRRRTGEVAEKLQEGGSCLKFANRRSCGTTKTSQCRAWTNLAKSKKWIHRAKARQLVARSYISDERTRFFPFSFSGISIACDHEGCQHPRLILHGGNNAFTASLILLI